MFVGICEATFRAEWVSSLKEKRMVVKSLVEKTRHKFNASVAEVDGGNSAVVAHIFEVIARLCREKGLESYRVVSNIGEQAGQSVHHLHFHVLSGRDMTWPPG